LFKKTFAKSPRKKEKFTKLLASTKLNYTRAMEKLSTKSTWRRYDIHKRPGSWRITAAKDIRGKSNVWLRKYKHAVSPLPPLQLVN